MASDRLSKLTASMRNVDGTPAGLVRDGLVGAVGRVLDLQFAVAKRIAPRPRLHPLFKVITAQIGEPTERWPVDDVDEFRVKFGSLVAFLPSSVRGRLEHVSFGSLSATKITPRGHLARGVVVYLHGGGFVLGDAESVLPEAGSLADLTKRVTYVLDYPLAPEVQFPDSLEVVKSALHAIAAATHGPLAIVGESAGGNFAVASLLADPRLRSQCDRLVLLYPFLDLTLSAESLERLGTGYFLTKKMLQWFVKSYLPVGSSTSDPRVSPGLSPDLDLLPRSLVVVGEFDPLVDDARTFTSRVPGSELVIVPGMIHGFLQMRRAVGAREKYLRYVAKFIRGI